MKFFIIFSLFLISACAHNNFSARKKKLIDAGNYLVSECTIYDLNGLVVRSYPGNGCIFLDDGSYVSYSTEKQELTKFNPLLIEEWRLKIHTHHGLRLTTDGKLLVNSSAFKNFSGKKDVRFDEVVLISLLGKIEAKFSFYDYLTKNTNLKDWKTHPFHWDTSVGLGSELTHLASSFEVLQEMKDPQTGKIFAPKGSFISTLNSNAGGIYILDSKLNKVINYLPINSTFNIHNSQQFTGTEIIYFLNNDSVNTEARIIIYDVFKQKVSKELKANLLAPYTGSVQAIGDDLLLISDLNGTPGPSKVVPTVVKNPGPLHFFEKIHVQKGRVLFFSQNHGVLDEINFDTFIFEAKVKQLALFLEKNIGI